MEETSLKIWHDGNFLTALKSMYENVSCTVKMNDQYSDWFDVNIGVKQGCILSPTLPCTLMI